MHTRIHPYRYEIKHISYPSRMFAPAPPIAPRSFEDTPFYWVSTPAEFGAMLEQLRTAREIAVDLEYHSYRTFGGFVCLMQISTRDADFVVDTLALRDEMEELRVKTAWGHVSLLWLNRYQPGNLEDRAGRQTLAAAGVAFTAIAGALECPKNSSKPMS